MPQYHHHRHPNKVSDRSRASQQSLQEGLATDQAPDSHPQHFHDSFIQYPAHVSPPLTPTPSPRVVPYPNPKSRRSSYTRTNQPLPAPYEVRCVLPAKASVPWKAAPDTHQDMTHITIAQLQKQQAALQVQLQQIATQQEIIALQLSNLVGLKNQTRLSAPSCDYNWEDFQTRCVMDSTDNDILAGLMFGV
ncbi:hypothetical protein HDU80_004426 [Chytriomyces hyalinus]|nr:hypothetical protein HDU80_004426 [Chytriomyces hyalinus]